MPSHIYELLRPIWLERRETSNRVRARIETIIAKNVDIDDDEFRNPAELTKQLRENFRSGQTQGAASPRPALCRDAGIHGDLLSADGKAAEAPIPDLHRLPNERGGRGAWAEIDRPASTWKIPSERMKMKEDHGVPLSEPALAILDDMRDGSQGRLDFPEPGRRGVFRDGNARRTRSPGLWSRDGARIPRDIRNLGRRMHRLSGWRPRGRPGAQVQSRDHRGLPAGHKLEKRRALMRDWAQFLAGSNVIRLDQAGWTDLPRLSLRPRLIHRASGSAQCHTKKKSRLWTEKGAKSCDRPSKKCAAPYEDFVLKIQSGMLRNVGGQQDAHMPRAGSIAFEAQLVASPKQAMWAIQVSRKKLYELINTGELESYTEGKSRRIPVKSINDYIERRLAAEAVRRGRAAS